MTIHNAIPRCLMLVGVITFVAALIYDILCCFGVLRWAKYVVFLLLSIIDLILIIWPWWFGVLSCVMAAMYTFDTISSGISVHDLFYLSNNAIIKNRSDSYRKRAIILSVALGFALLAILMYILCGVMGIKSATKQAALAKEKLREHQGEAMDEKESKTRSKERELSSASTFDGVEDLPHSYGRGNDSVVGVVEGPVGYYPFAVDDDDETSIGDPAPRGE
eukprot:GHVN01044700.1.p1 GENE.GHVN01044700.1~~GHVN01044700.1.p1  ORF type:complete len:220 (+),score=38.83 GHVN01044700.1:41-700(+)